jgi:hypothetical protein
MDVNFRLPYNCSNYAVFADDTRRKLLALDSSFTRVAQKSRDAWGSFLRNARGKAIRFIPDFEQFMNLIRFDREMLIGDGESCHDVGEALVAYLDCENVCIGTLPKFGGSFMFAEFNIRTAQMYHRNRPIALFDCSAMRKSEVILMKSLDEQLTVTGTATNLSTFLSHNDGFIRGGSMRGFPSATKFSCPVKMNHATSDVEGTSGVPSVELMIKVREWNPVLCGLATRRFQLLDSYYEHPYDICFVVPCRDVWEDEETLNQLWTIMTVAHWFCCASCSVKALFCFALRNSTICWSSSGVSVRSRMPDHEYSDLDRDVLSKIDSLLKEVMDDSLDSMLEKLKRDVDAYWKIRGFSRDSIVMKCDDGRLLVKNKAPRYQDQSRGGVILLPVEDDRIVGYKLPKSILSVRCHEMSVNDLISIYDEWPSYGIDDFDEIDAEWAIDHE